MAKGRPRAFNMQEALEQAMHLFWEKGYEGTTLSDLTSAMGINRPSLYAAFGNKEELFYKVVDLYVDETSGVFLVALREAKGRDAIEKALYGAIVTFTEDSHPPGCLTVHGALSCGEEAEPIRKELIQRRAATEAVIRLRIERAKDEGELPDGTDTVDLGHYFSTVLFGLAVEAASGASREKLNRVVGHAMKAWPASE
ncbi:TetR/AcrR family transcriptional regulator [Paenibacillus sepulcri]